jgi:hypothetical protein
MLRNSSTLRTSTTLAAAVFAAQLIAGCGAGSQFAPTAGFAGSQTTGLPQASQISRNRIISPDWEMWTGVVNGHYYYVNTHGQWIWLKTGYDQGKGNSATVGGSLASASEIDVAMTTGDINIVTNGKLTATLGGSIGIASAVETDPYGNTFATVNASGEAILEEYAAGSDVPTATYQDANLQSIAGVAIDKTGHVYVQGQSQYGNIEVDEMVGSGSFEPLAAPGALGATAGGLAVQTSAKATYVWINDLGNASAPANIARYALTGSSLVKDGSFEYSGINGGIAVDPTGKNTTDVYAVNNVSAGSQYSVTGIEYAFPSGKTVVQSSATTEGQESIGIWRK